MNILVDENIPSLTVSHLRKTGHNVSDIRGCAEQGISDDLLWEKAQREKRLLITTDMWFARYRRENHHGVLIVRLNQPKSLKIHQRVIEAIGVVNSSDWYGTVVIMQERSKRIWKLRKH